MGLPRPGRRPLTMALIAICLIVFLLLESPESMPRWSWRGSASRPNTGTSKVAMRSNGLNHILRGEVWRLVTPIFLHTGILHVFFNVWALTLFGTMIEVRRGTLRLAVLVLVAAVGSPTLGSISTWNRTIPASSKVSGGFRE